MSALRQVLRRGLEAALPQERFLVRGPSSRMEVALTFDDGPHPDVTPRLLDALAHQKIAATFFVIGREAERYPALVRRIVAEGHALGHHSWTHSEPSATSSASLLAEIDRCRALLHELTGIWSDRFRPPKGQLTASKLLGLLHRRQRVVLWSEDPRDYALSDSTPLIDWSNSASLSPGAIVLLHDCHRWCLDAVEPLAQRAARGEFRLVTIDAWLPASR
ncbi:MAG: polysaccharide deacetylase family protein [Gemmatimonadota bacterium]